MPNWCYNSLTIHGDLAERKRLADLVREEKGDDIQPIVQYTLGNAYPIPEDLVIRAVIFSNEDTPEAKELQAKQEANLAKYGYRDWYLWCVDNWGTKWSPRVEEDAWNEESDLTTAFFDTAWSPPSELLKKISELFPTLLFVNVIDEESNAFLGCDAYQGGVEVASHGTSFGSDIPEQFVGRFTELTNNEDMDDDDRYDELSDLYMEMKCFYETMVYDDLRKALLYPTP